MPFPLVGLCRDSQKASERLPAHPCWRVERQTSSDGSNSWSGHNLSGATSSIISIRTARFPLRFCHEGNKIRRGLVVKANWNRLCHFLLVSLLPAQQNTRQIARSTRSNSGRPSRGDDRNRHVYSLKRASREYSTIRHGKAAKTESGGG